MGENPEDIDIKRYDPKSNLSYILEVDLIYPLSLLSKHKDYPVGKFIEQTYDCDKLSKCENEMVN